MATLLWDASALVKRYVEEMGSRTVEALFSAAPQPAVAVAVVCYAEVFSILLRRYNGGVIGQPSFERAVAALRNETVLDPRVDMVTLDDATVFSSIEIMRRHNLNSSDAIILSAYLRYALPRANERCILVAADQRLVRAASAEGMETLNPEVATASDATESLARG